MWEKPRLSLPGNIIAEWERTKARVAGLLEKMLEGGKVKKTEGKRTCV